VAAGVAWGDVLDRAALQHTDAVAAVGIKWNAGGGTFLRGWVGGSLESAMIRLIQPQPR